MQNNLQPNNDPEYNRNLTLALVIIVLFMSGWYYFYEAPHVKAIQVEQQKALAERVLKAKEIQALQEQADKKDIKTGLETLPANATRSDILALAKTERVQISSNKLHGSINVNGLRFDDITLAKYKETLAKDSPDAVLLSPPGITQAQYIETGWISADKSILAPDANTKWQVEGNTTLTPTTPVTLFWDNALGFKFITKISLDDNYMFSVEQKVENHSAAKASFFPYALISETEPSDKKIASASRSGRGTTVHTGPIGVMDKTLKYVTYKDLREATKKEFPDSTGWIGMTDKYWAQALIPQQDETYTANFRYFTEGDNEKFQVDYLGKEKQVAPNESVTYNSKIFAGAKELSILDDYRDKLHLPLFERLIDFGWLNILTEPMMKLLAMFYTYLGNAGLAILALTFCMKLILFPLARKSYISMGRIRELTPKIQQLKEQYKDDKLELNKKMMELYKKEKINPASGCLPLLLQMPIFFAIIKVFAVSIEMRHAPFFGWIHDLSVPDPTSFANLFGLIPFHAPEALMIGAWPCMWAVTMYLLQKLTPAPNMGDPMQQKLIKFMPLIFVIFIAKAAAALAIYYVFSNTMTVFQQLYFLKFHGHRIKAGEWKD